MEVIMLENVAKIGKKGDIIKVAQGYFLNFLAPKKIARLATEQDKATYLKNLEKKVHELENDKKSALSLKDKLQGQKIHIKAKANGRSLYAAVNAAKIISVIVDTCKIRLKDSVFDQKLNLKNVGEHIVSIKLHPEVTTDLLVVIEADGVK